MDKKELRDQPLSWFNCRVLVIKVRIFVISQKGWNRQLVLMVDNICCLFCFRDNKCYIFTF